VKPFLTILLLLICTLYVKAQNIQQQAQQVISIRLVPVSVVDWPEISNANNKSSATQTTATGLPANWQLQKLETIDANQLNTPLNRNRNNSQQTATDYKNDIATSTTVYTITSI